MSFFSCLLIRAPKETVKPISGLTEAEFLDFYSKAYFEPVDKIGQIAYHKFTGEELLEFVNDAIKYKSEIKK